MRLLRSGLALVLVLVATSPAFAAKKVLIVSIDGCRPDALQLADTPNLDALIGAGAVSYTSESSHTATHSGPNYSSMLTGVDTNKHGVTTNEFTGSHFDLWPSLFHRLEAAQPSLYTASYVQWGPINTGIGIDHVADAYGAGADSWVATQAANLLKTGNPDVLFVEVEGVDQEGHASGFSPTNPKYVSAIHTADANVGTVLAALEARPGYIDRSEDWLLLTTTDHGGSGTAHEPSGGAATWTTFTIVDARTVEPGRDLGSPRVYDIGVTALDHMGLAIEGLGLDGKVLDLPLFEDGDVDKNGRVDIFDVAVVQTKYGMTSGATWADGDFDGNGTVDIFDVGLMQVNYGHGVGTSPMSVPEPSALVLAALGLAGLAFLASVRR
ncbi:MAG: alkaline phosphatase family protein [Pirellulales bacterium]